jgi:hypothetical protein
MIPILVHALFGLLFGLRFAGAPERTFWILFAGLVAAITLMVGDVISTIAEGSVERAVLWLILVIPAIWGTLQGVRLALRLERGRS